MRHAAGSMLPRGPVTEERPSYCAHCRMPESGGAAVVGVLWDDRLVEVWASPRSAGSGVLVGSDGVLTARHVIAGALAGGRVLARVVRPHGQVGAWVPM